MHFTLFLPSNTIGWWEVSDGKTLVWQFNCTSTCYSSRQLLSHSVPFSFCYFCSIVHPIRSTLSLLPFRGKCCVSVCFSICVCAHIVVNAYCFLSLFALCFHAFAIVRCCSYHLCDFCWLPEQKKATERCCRSKCVLIIPCIHTRDAKNKTQKNNPRLSYSKWKKKLKEENYTEKKNKKLLEQGEKHTATPRIPFHFVCFFSLRSFA